MKNQILEIGSKITFHTPSGKKVEGVITGRNWSYDHLVSYVVRYDGMDMPVCAKSFKAQLIC